MTPFSFSQKEKGAPTDLQRVPYEIAAYRPTANSPYDTIKLVVDGIKVIHAYHPFPACLVFFISLAIAQQNLRTIP